MSPSLELQREGIRKAWGWARVQEGRVRGDCRVESVVERAKAILKKKIIRPNYTVVIPTRNSYPPPSACRPFLRASASLRLSCEGA
jgi:hypothetical protein